MAYAHHAGDDVVVEAFGEFCSATVLDDGGPEHVIRLEDGRFAGTQLMLHDMYLHEPGGPPGPQRASAARRLLPRAGGSLAA